LVPLKNFIINLEEKILINPNWITSVHYSTSNITSTDTLEGIDRYLIQETNIGPEKMIIADDGSVGKIDKFYK